MKKLLLVFAGLLLSFVFYREAYPTTILQYHDGQVFRSHIAGPLTAGKAIAGQFVAVYDNLATVKLRINTFNRMNTTHIRFRLRELGETDWLATNEYTIDRFVDGLLYPFGFPVIQNSRGNAYEFEVAGVDGSPDDALSIEQGYHDMASLYVPTARNAQFAREKLMSMIVDPYLWLYLGLFLVPALGLIVKQRFLLLAYLLFVYIFLPVDMHSNIVLYIAAAGWYIGRLERASAKAAYIVGIVCLLVIPATLAFGNVLAATRAAMLVFFSLLVAAMMSL